MTGLLSRARSINRVTVGIKDGLMDIISRPVEQSSGNESCWLEIKDVLLNMNDRPVEQSSVNKSG